jgi:hypothetical protein
MWETAKILVDIAVKTHMQMFGVDRETAREERASTPNI